MTRKIRLLIVEDEAAIRVGLVDLFVFHGYEVDTAEEGPIGLKKALTGTYDLILLDVMLPGMDGFEICNRIREEDRDQPIIMLTAKSSDEDIIQGLSLGADDYVAKPFSVAQLVLRVQAVLRRSRVGVENDSSIQLGDDLIVDCRNLQGDRCGEEISFTRREMDVLQYLHRQAERPVPREELLEYLSAHSERAVSREGLLTKVWGYAKHLDLETRTVDIHIAKLRRKIETDPAHPIFLVTVRGAGYRLVR